VGTGRAPPAKRHRPSQTEQGANGVSSIVLTAPRSYAPGALHQGPCELRRSGKLTTSAYPHRCLKVRGHSQDERGTGAGTAGLACDARSAPTARAFLSQGISVPEGVSHVLDLSEGSSKLISINEEPNHQIVHLFRLGKTNRTTH